MSDLKEESEYLARKKEIDERRKRRKEKYALNYQKESNVSSERHRTEEIKDHKINPSVVRKEKKDCQPDKNTNNNKFREEDDSCNETYLKQLKLIEERREARRKKFSNNYRTRTSTEYVPERKTKIEYTKKSQNKSRSNISEDNAKWQDIKSVDKATKKQIITMEEIKKTIAVALVLSIPTSVVAGLVSYNYFSNLPETKQAAENQKEMDELVSAYKKIHEKLDYGDLKDRGYYDPTTDDEIRKKIAEEKRNEMNEKLMNSMEDGEIDESRDW